VALVADRSEIREFICGLVINFFVSTKSAKGGDVVDDQILPIFLFMLLSRLPTVKTTVLGVFQALAPLFKPVFTVVISGIGHPVRVVFASHLLLSYVPQARV
jgi:hypothetical protein